MFEARAARFRALADGSPLADYLTFLASLAEAQHTIQPGLSEPAAPDAEALDRAFSFGMPPLDRGRLRLDRAATETFERLLARAAAIDCPAPAAAARERLAGDATLREKTLDEALEAAASVETLAEHVFAAAALQVHFARLASRLDAKRLKPVGTGACPCCGGPPVASLVVGWASAHGVRYVACALCGTFWNHVRVKCVACDSTKGIGYQALEAPNEAEVAPAAGKRRDGGPAIRAETCDTCRCYVKIFSQHLDPAIDPVADDVASLGLDIKVREAGWARAAFNPFLLGY